MTLTFPTQTPALFPGHDAPLAMAGQAAGWRMYGPEDLPQEKRAALVGLAKTMPVGGFLAMGGHAILRTDGADYWIGLLHAGGFAEVPLVVAELRES